MPSLNLKWNSIVRGSKVIGTSNLYVHATSNSSCLINNSIHKSRLYSNNIVTLFDRIEEGVRFNLLSHHMRREADATHICYRYNCVWFNECSSIEKWLKTYRGLDKLISIRRSAHGEGGWVAPDHRDCCSRGLAKGLTLDPFGLLKNRWWLEERCWSHSLFYFISFALLKRRTPCVLCVNFEILSPSQYHKCTLLLSPAGLYL